MIESFVGYRYFYKSRILKEMALINNGGFSYLIDMYWINGDIKISLRGFFDKEANKSIINSIDISSNGILLNNIDISKYIQISGNCDINIKK